MNATSRRAGGEACVGRRFGATFVWRLLRAVVGFGLGGAAGTAMAQTWQSSDVGFPTPAGSSSEAGGVVTVRGSGADIWGSADHFHFRHQALAGDGEVVARIVSQQNTDPWAKAGIMMRTSLLANSGYAAVFLTPHGQLVLQERLASGGETTSRTLTWTSAPVWVRLLRRGAHINAYYSSDGSSWQGDITTGSGVGSNAMAGVAVTSHRDGVLSTATFDNVRVTPTSAAPAPTAPSQLVATSVAANLVSFTWTDHATDETGFQLERGTDGSTFTVVANFGENATGGTDASAVAGTAYHYRVRAVRGGTTSVPSNVVQVTTPSGSSSVGADMAWHDRDIGSPIAAGSSSETRTQVLTVRGAGDDIWGTADEFHFRYKTITGDGEVSANVTTVDNTDPSAKAGLMIRAGLEPGAACAFLAFNPSFAATFYRRTAAGSAMATAGSTAWLWPGARLRLERRGDVFNAYANNQLVGSVTVAMPATVAIGFAVTSHRDGMVCAATFESYRVYQATPTSPLAGPVALTATLASSGAIDLAWDYTGTEATSIEVHISHDGVTFWNNWSTGGTRAIYTATTPGVWYYFKLRARSGANVSAFSNVVSVQAPAAAAPAAPSDLTVAVVSSTSLRLNWRDNATNETGFRILRKREGFNDTWFPAPANATTYTDTGLEPGTTYTYDVFALGEGANSTFVTASATTSPASTPVAEFRSEDIGAPAAAGQTVLGTDMIALSGAGDDIWDARDEFRSYARDLTGDGEVVVRVDAIQNTHAWAKAGIMLRASADPGAANILLYVTPDFRVTLQMRAQNGGASQLIRQIPAAAPVWLRLRRTGSEVAAAMSTDQVNWGHVDQLTINLPSTVRAGLAVTSHVDGTLCRAQFANLRVFGGTSAGPTPPPPPPPQPPATTAWTQTAIGVQGVSGSVTELTNGSVTVRAAGTDIWDTADGFVFFHRTLSGDGSLTARVQSLQDTHAWAKAGVMIRATLEPESPHVLAYITPSNGAGAHVRATRGGATSITAGPWWVDAPYHVRITRAGSTISTHGSEDGTTWTLISTQTLALPTDAFVGLAVTSHDPTRLNEVQFTQVAATPQ